jgi:hypothetical protein
VVVTEVFVNLAQTAARARGVDPIPMLVLPLSLEGRGDTEIDHIAAQRFRDAMALLVSP